METHERDLSLLLPRDTYYQLIHTLKAALPPPLADTQEALLHRDNAAMAEVASLAPVNAEEAEVAADFDRLKRRGDYKAVDGAAWAEHCALHMRAEAARSVPSQAAGAKRSIHATESHIVVDETTMRRRRPRMF